MGGQTQSTQEQANAPMMQPFIGSAPSDPRDMPDPLIEGLKWLSGSGSNAQAPQSAPQSPPVPQAPVQQAQQQPPVSPTMPANSYAQDNYTIPPDPLIEALKYLTGYGQSAKNAPKRR